jgi:hypothetical protein
MFATIDMRAVYDGLREEFRMRIRVWKAAFLVGLGLGAAVAQAPPQSQPQPMPMGGMSMDHGTDMGHGMSKPSIPASSLKVVFGDKSTEWTPAALAALPHKPVTVFNVHAKVNQTYSGVPLIDLLTPLGVPAKPHGKDLRLYLVAEGSDRYQAVYSVAEVNPDLHDATVIVADSLDGKPIGDSGPLLLVATGDKRPARWVRNLVAVRVLTVQ